VLPSFLILVLALLLPLLASCLIAFPALVFVLLVGVEDFFCRFGVYFLILLRLLGLPLLLVLFFLGLRLLLLRLGLRLILGTSALVFFLRGGDPFSSDGAVSFARRSCL